MTTLREIALVNEAGAQDPADFAFAAEACRVQLEQHFLPMWGSLLPDNCPMTVVGYSRTTDLKPGTYWGIQVLHSLDDPSVYGDHGGLRGANMAWGRSLARTTTQSHEVLEMAGDHFADRWAPLPDGRVVAFEHCDAVELDHYPLTVTIPGVGSRVVMVSNFVGPAWYGEGVGMLDYMGLCRAPGENRGYIIERRPDGSTVNVFADSTTPEYRASVNAKMAYASRTAHRHRV